MNKVDKQQYKELLGSWRDGSWLTDGEIQRLGEGLCAYGNPGDLPDLIDRRISKTPHELRLELVKLFMEVMASCGRDKADAAFQGACKVIRKRLVVDERSIDLFIATSLMLERNQLVLQQRTLMDLWTDFYKLGRVANRFDLTLLLAGTR